MVRRLTISLLAGLAPFVFSVAQAADYSQPLPPPPVYMPPPQQECCEGWYLRGQIGVSMVKGSDAQFIQNPANSSDFVFESTSYSDSYFVGGGIGYEWNSWLRLDATAEYRAKARINAFGHYTDGAGGVFLDTYEGYLKSWVFLANAYVDLGTWECFTPFVGFGIGAAYNTLYNFNDIGPQTGGRGFGRNPSEWHFAWALHAGVAYSVNKNFKVELAYRYLNYGSITDTIDCVGGCNADSYKFDKLYSHDIMLGFRWTFCCDVPPPPKYVYAPPPVYTAPPVYTPPPPLRSKG